MFIGSSLAASSVFTSGGFSLQIIKAKVLEVGDKLLIYIQRAEGGTSPHGRDSCAVSLRSTRQQLLFQRCCVDSSCWPDMESTPTLSLRITTRVCKHECL